MPKCLASIFKKLILTLRLTHPNKRESVFVECWIIWKSNKKLFAFILIWTESSHRTQLLAFQRRNLRFTCVSHGYSLFTKIKNQFPIQTILALRILWVSHCIQRKRWVDPMVMSTVFRWILYRLCRYTHTHKIQPIEPFDFDHYLLVKW